MSTLKPASLTPKQKKILDFIISFYENEGFAPSLSEIAKRFKKSTTTIYQFVETLKEKGFLVKKDNTWRGLSPVSSKSNILLLGYIAAGQPIEPLENPESIDTPASMTMSPGNYYALKVKGDSMIEDGIMDEDTIVVRHQNTAEIGDTIVAITEDGATLKIFKKKDGKIYLEPRNRNLKNIYPKELEIRGKFCGLIRKG